MIGPVLEHEVLRANRRGWQALFRRLYTGWLVLLFLFFYWLYLLNTNILSRWFFEDIPLNSGAAGGFASNLFQWLLLHQLFLVLLATPVLSAGAITDEKASGNLQHLLCSQLSAAEIICGKLLGRAWLIFQLVLAPLPLICFIGVFGGISIPLLALTVLVPLAPLFGLGAVSLLASVWVRQTRDAVLAVVVLLVVGFLGLQAAGMVKWFNPLHALDPAWSDGQVSELVWRLVVLALVWSAIGLLCLPVAIWRLRPAYRRQLQGAGPRKREHWWQPTRAAVGLEPIRWKEQHVEGIAPLAVLRRIPRWVGIVVIFTLTVGVGGAILMEQAPTRLTLDQVLRAIRDLNFAYLWHDFEGAQESFLALAVVALLVATTVVAVRCSGAVTGEREKQTWEALLLTPLPVQGLIRAKLWGILGASFPYLLAYFVPHVLLSFLTGPSAAWWVSALLIATVLAMGYAGASGLWLSVRSKGSWRSLFLTLLTCYGAGFILLVPTSIIILILMGLIQLTLFLLDLVTQGQFALSNLGGAVGFLFAAVAYLATLSAYALAAWFFIRDAESYVANRERIRHWKEEPLPQPRSSKSLAVTVEPTPSE